MQRRGPFELEPELCRSLLASVDTGRVGMSTPLGPHVAPVGYTVVDDAIILWTPPYSVVARCAPGALIAFEVDHVDPVTRDGWCVQARGRAELLSDPATLETLAPVLSMHPDPWEERGRRYYLRIRWTELTGQAVGNAWPEATGATPGVTTGVTTGVTPGHEAR